MQAAVHEERYAYDTLARAYGNTDARDDDDEDDDEDDDDDHDEDTKAHVCELYLVVRDHRALLAFASTRPKLSVC